MKERIEEQEYRAIYNFLMEVKCPLEMVSGEYLDEFYGPLLPKGHLGVFRKKLPESSNNWVPSVKTAIKRIRRLNLHDLATKHLPFSFYPFSNLEELSFNSSDFGSLSIDWSVLPKLRYLDLSNLQWLLYFPKLDGLKNLEVLALRFLNSDLNGFSDDVFSGLTNLRVLDLRHSRLHNLFFFESLRGLKNLEYVDLRSASYTKPIPSLDCKILTGKDRVRNSF